MVGQYIGTENYRIIGRLLSANMNSTADQALTIDLDAGTGWMLDRIVFTNASTSMTTAVGGVYNAASKPGGGILIAASQVYSQLTTAASYVSAPISGVASTTIQTVSTIYLSLTTPQGAPATADLYVFARLFAY